MRFGDGRARDPRRGAGRPRGDVAPPRAAPASASQLHRGTLDARHPRRPRRGDRPAARHGRRVTWPARPHRRPDRRAGGPLRGRRHRRLAAAQLACVAAAALGAALGLYRGHPVAAPGAGRGRGGRARADRRPGAGARHLVCANAFAAGRWTVATVSVATAVALLAASLGAAVWADNADGWLVPAILLVGTAWIAGRAIRERDLVAARLAERAESSSASARRSPRSRSATSARGSPPSCTTSSRTRSASWSCRPAPASGIAAVDPELTGETFAAIAGAARQAEQDMTQLVALLADDDAIGPRARPHARRGAGRARGRERPRRHPAPGGLARGAARAGGPRRPTASCARA